jgi:hypothetical protein
MAATPPIEKLATELDPESEQFGLLYDPARTGDWIESFLTIPNEHGTIVKMKLYPQQHEMLLNQTGRDNTVKGRQTRASSLILARNLRRMTTNFGLNCFVMTQDDPTTQTFRWRIKHHLTDLARAGLKYEIVMDNENELVIGGLENRFIWASAEQRVAGRAYTINIFHGSEAAHWKPENEGIIVGGILPAIPDPPFGWADFESTPNGAEGLFYDQVMESRPIEDFALWSTWFYPWYREPRYTIDTWQDNDLPQHFYDMIAEMRRTFVPAPDETVLLDVHKLSMGQILWRRLKMREMSRTTTPFLQEYPEDLLACFLSTAESFFASDDGQDHLSVHRQNQRPPVQHLSMLPFRESVVQFRGSNLAVWETPNLTTPYAMYQDTSKGGTSKDSDPSVIMVMNARTGHVVAKLVVKATPREVAEMGCAIGQYYNMALYGGERDAWGSQSLDRVRELSYPHIFYYLDPQKLIADRRPDAEPWVYPTEQNRDRMLLKLREGMFDHSLVVPDQTTLLEMGAFTWVKLRDRYKLRGQGRRTHDDHVMALAGCTLVAEAAARARPRKQESDLITIGRFGQVIRTKANGAKPWMR